jgi:hypothetical protein
VSARLVSPAWGGATTRLQRSRRRLPRAPQRQNVSWAFFLATSVGLPTGKIERFVLGRLAELVHRAHLKLANALLGEVQDGSDLLEGLGLLTFTKPETPLNDPPLPFVEVPQQFLNLRSPSPPPGDTSATTASCMPLASEIEI